MMVSGGAGAVQVAEKDVLFPGEAILARAREIIPNLVAAELLKGYGHVAPRAGLERLNDRILRFLSAV